MRYAVVIDKAEGNYSAYLPDALSPASPSRQLRAKFATRFAFTSKVRGQTDCPFLRQLLSAIAWTHS
jgi:hypothetical protein